MHTVLGISERRRPGEKWPVDQGVGAGAECNLTCSAAQLLQYYSGRGDDRAHSCNVERRARDTSRRQSPVGPRSAVDRCVLTDTVVRSPLPSLTTRTISLLSHSRRRTAENAIVVSLTAVSSLILLFVNKIRASYTAITR